MPYGWVWHRTCPRRWCFTRNAYVQQWTSLVWQWNLRKCFLFNINHIIFGIAIFLQFPDWLGIWHTHAVAYSTIYLHVLHRHVWHRRLRCQHCGRHHHHPSLHQCLLLWTWMIQLQSDSCLWVGHQMDPRPGDFRKRNELRLFQRSYWIDWNRKWDEETLSTSSFKLNILMTSNNFVENEINGIHDVTPVFPKG